MLYRCIAYFEGFTVGKLYPLIDCTIRDDDDELYEITVAELVEHFELED